MRVTNGKYRLLDNITINTGEGWKDYLDQMTCNYKDHKITHLETDKQTERS